MSEVLQKLGFTVFKYENLSQVQMKKAIDDFGFKLKGNDVGLFFYAGHGIQSKGYNYLIPVDAQLQSEQEVEYDCVQADRILVKMEGSGTKVNIIILDACRNNPFERSWTRSTNGQGLAFMNAPKGTLIAYATSPGSTASDGSGRNGLYTSAILESISKPNLTIESMFKNVRNIVSQKSQKQQTPWESTSLTGNFYFNTGQMIDQLVQETYQNKITNEEAIPENINYITDSRDNTTYKTIVIGTQVWMAEKLKASKFNDGTAIPLVTSDKAWGESTTAAYCWYGNNETENKILYGALYNWYAVNSGKLCPAGWHVPSNTEWTVLTNYLGGEELATGKLITPDTTYWISINPWANNESGFTALPGGRRLSPWGFLDIGSSGYWWSSTENFQTTAWFRYISYKNNIVGKIQRLIKIMG